MRTRAILRRNPGAVGSLRLRESMLGKSGFRETKFGETRFSKQVEQCQHAFWLLMTAHFGGKNSN